MRPVLSDEDMEIDSDIDPELIDPLDKEYRKPNYFDMGILQHNIRSINVAQLCKKDGSTKTRWRYIIL